MAEKLYLVDGHSLIFQVFHAIPEMSAPDGRPTNAVFGFTRDLLFLMENKKPDYLICALDASGPTFRDALYPAYKATRGPMPDNLRPQIDMIREVTRAMGIPVLECPGFEADDIIATIVRHAEDRGIDSFICSGDKDTRQLIGPHVQIYNIRKDAVFDEAALEGEWGVRPDQVVDLLALAGDTVDNIAGIEGIGPKTAAALLRQFGTLEAVLANVDRISSKKRQENVRKGAEAARLARTLVELRSDAPIQVDWQAAGTGKPDATRLAELFRQFGFRRLAAQFGAQAHGAARWEAVYRTVEDWNTLDRIAAELSSQPQFAIHVVTPDEAPRNARIIGIALCWKPGEAWYIPVRSPLGEPDADRPMLQSYGTRSVPGPLGEADIDQPALLARLGPVLESQQHGKIGHDLKRQLLVLRSAGVTFAGLVLDTTVADYLMEAGERSHTIDQLSLRYLRHTASSAAEFVGESRNPLPLDRVPRAQISRFACEMADVVLRVSQIQQQRLREEGLWPLYESVERPLIEVLADMEFEGIRIDLPFLERLSREFERKLAEIEAQIYKLAGQEFNIGSPIQLRQVLFEKLKLPVLRRTKTGPSTDQEVLDTLAGQHPLPALLIEHRQIAKLKSTYVDALPQVVNRQTGRVHATFNQVVAATGRLSSSDPNLQNIPIRTEQGRQVREAFIAREGHPKATGHLDESSGEANRSAWKLVTADYSQVELRILAHFSGDAELCRAFAADQDIHKFVAAQIHGVQPDAVTPQMRRQAKTVNFGVIYGLTPFGLAARLGMEPQEAEAFINAYFQKYSGVQAFIAKVLKQAHRESYVTTLLGRQRRISGVRSNPGRWLNQPEREAVNTVIQGSAADLIKVAMVNLHRRMRRERLESKMLLQIHDELVFEVPADELAYMAGIIAQEMTGAIGLNVPLKVDLAAGPNWLEVEPIRAAAVRGSA